LLFSEYNILAANFLASVLIISRTDQGESMKRLFMRNLLVLAVALTWIFSLTGCGVDRITKANFDKVKIGMTETEVQAILGPPTESTGVDVAVFAGTTSIWRHKDVVITIQFVNGKVVAKHFAKTPE
jgi:outer membrane protein assembly factor BamE (lipoprotein component of BamABCDE complex)